MATQIFMDSFFIRINVLDLVCSILLQRYSFFLNYKYKMEGTSFNPIHFTFFVLKIFIY